MKKTAKKIKNIYDEKNISLYTSLIGSVVMGTVHLVTLRAHFSALTLSCCLFFYLLALIRLGAVCLDRGKNKRILYLAGATSLCVLIIPMTEAIVRTIAERHAPKYIFSWMIYVYAVYGTLKFVFAVRSRHAARKSGDVCRGVLSWVSLVAAAYTLQMMEFALIETFDADHSDAMVYMQYFTHGAIIAFTVFVIVYLILRYKRSENDADTKGNDMKNTKKTEAARPRAALVIEADGVRRYANLEDNASARALAEKLSPEPVTIELSDRADGYIGALPWELPHEDGMLEAGTGDILLFGGDGLLICLGECTRCCAKLAGIGATKEELLDLFTRKEIKIYLEWSE